MKSLILAGVGPPSVNLLSASGRKKFDQLHDSWCSQYKNKSDTSGHTTNPDTETNRTFCLIWIVGTLCNALSILILLQRVL